ncbi:hypothetical protein DYH09_10575 [bacterium CPR1]|nr:hypothetical protein [bacterium CPR1]
MNERIQALEKAVAEARRVQRQDYNQLMGGIASLHDATTGLHRRVSAVEQAVSPLQEAVSTLQEAVSTLQESVSTLQESVSTVEEAVRVQSGLTGGLHGSMLSYQSSSLSLFDLLYGAVVAESDQKDAALEEIFRRLDRLENPPAA